MSGTTHSASGAAYSKVPVMLCACTNTQTQENPCWVEYIGETRWNPSRTTWKNLEELVIWLRLWCFIGRLCPSEVQQLANDRMVHWVHYDLFGLLWSCPAEWLRCCLWSESSLVWCLCAWDLGSGSDIPIPTNLILAQTYRWQSVEAQSECPEKWE